MSLSVQWGTYETANASAKLITITFPVSFAVTAYSVALGHKGLSNWTNGANVDYVNKTVSDMTVYYCDGYGFSWLAIGMQQWGLTTSASEVVTYPIAVSQVYCLLLTTKATTFRYSPWPTAITTKSFQAVSDSEPAYWLLVAKQQWGHKDNSTSIVTFNLSFPTTCFIALVETLNDGTVNSHLRLSGATNVGFSTWDSSTNRPYSVQNYWLALGI